MRATRCERRVTRAIVALSGAFCLALVGLVAARDVATFLGFWELMTLLPASVILVVRQDERARRDVFAYLAITHLGGIGVWASMLVLADHGALGGAPLHGGGLRALVAVAAIVGFGTKAGAMPLHSWLPRAHPLAPANVSALMSGVMIKLALYGLIRVLFSGTAPVPLWVGLTLLALGALSAVGGVLYALFQHELKRLLAFHSIENVGIIVLGLGASLVFASIGRWQWSAIAFAAALLHTLNHAVFKALLFLGRRARSRAAVGALELDRLGGLSAADAVDGRRVRGRRDGDRRPAAAERVRVGVDDAPVAAARRRVRAVRRRRSPARSRPLRWPRPRRWRCSAS